MYEISRILCDFPWLFHDFSLTFPWLFQSVQDSLTFLWLENAFPFFQDFPSKWDPLQIGFYVLNTSGKWLSQLCQIVLASNGWSFRKPNLWHSSLLRLPQCWVLIWLVCTKFVTVVDICPFMYQECIPNSRWLRQYSLHKRDGQLFGCKTSASYVFVTLTFKNKSPLSLSLAKIKSRLFTTKVITGITGDKSIHQYVVMTSAKIGMNQIQLQNLHREYVTKGSNKNQIFPCQSRIRGYIGHFNLNSTAPAINMCYFGRYKLDFWADFVNVKR